MCGKTMLISTRCSPTSLPRGALEPWPWTPRLIKSICPRRSWDLLRKQPRTIRIRVPRWYRGVFISWLYRLTSHLGLEGRHEPRLDVELPGKALALTLFGFWGGPRRENAVFGALRAAAAGVAAIGLAKRENQAVAVLAGVALELRDGLCVGLLKVFLPRVFLIRHVFRTFMRLPKRSR